MTKNDLNILEHNRREIHILQAQLNSLCEPIGAAPMTGMPSGGGGKNAVERIVVEKDSIRAEINALQQESRRICFQIEPPRTRRVFILFYADGKSWRQVADEMGYLDGSTPRKMKIEYIRRNIH